MVITHNSTDQWIHWCNIANIKTELGNINLYTEIGRMTPSDCKTELRQDKIVTLLVISLSKEEYHIAFSMGSLPIIQKWNQKNILEVRSFKSSNHLSG